MTILLKHFRVEWGIRKFVHGMEKDNINLVVQPFPVWILGNKNIGLIVNIEITNPSSGCAVPGSVQQTSCTFVFIVLRFQFHGSQPNLFAVRIGLESQSQNTTCCCNIALHRINNENVHQIKIVQVNTLHVFAGEEDKNIKTTKYPMETIGCLIF